MIIVPPKVTLLAVTQDVDIFLERCGRICYKSEDRITADSAPKFVGSLLGKQHDSVIEHASATLHFVCDRGVSHEIVRHRIASYSQESTRYCNYSKDKYGGEISVINPFVGETEEDKARRLVWERVVKATEEGYMELIQMGTPAQYARSVLPTCLKTELIMTANMREWRWFFRKRLPPDAHPQMREVAHMAYVLLRETSPTLFKEFGVED